MFKHSCGSQKIHNTLHDLSPFPIIPLISCLPLMQSMQVTYALQVVPTLRLLSGSFLCLQRAALSLASFKSLVCPHLSHEACLHLYICNCNSLLLGTSDLLTHAILVSISRHAYTRIRQAARQR